MAAGGPTEAIMDEYVMMRLAELIESGRAADAIDRAMRHGNFGGEALAARAVALREAIQRLQGGTKLERWYKRV